MEKWLFEQQIPLEELIKKGFRKGCKIKAFFVCIIKRFRTPTPFSRHRSILSFYWTFLENFPLTMKCLIKNQGNVFFIPFYLTS